MSKEGKAAFIGLLTTLAYSSSVYFDTGSWIFPFPLFDYILFILAALFTYWNKEFRTIFVFFTLVFTLRILGDSFFWSFFLQGTDLYDLFDSSVIAWIRLFEAILMIPLIILIFGYKGIFQKLSMISAIVLFVISVIPPFEMVNYLVFTCIAILYLFQKDMNRSIYYLLGITALFDLMEGFSVYFMS